jgi:hypothetical protein
MRNLLDIVGTSAIIKDCSVILGVCIIIIGGVLISAVIAVGMYPKKFYWLLPGNGRRR